MTDRIDATLAVIEAAENATIFPMDRGANEHLWQAVNNLADATSPDLDAKIAEVLPWSDGGRAAELRGAVRDLIVSLSTVGAEPYWWGIRRGRQEGFEQAREQAAKACEDQAAIFLSPEYSTEQPLSSFGERFACGQCAEVIRALTPDTERTG